MCVLTPRQATSALASTEASTSTYVSNIEPQNNEFSTLASFNELYTTGKCYSESSQSP